MTVNSRDHRGRAELHEPGLEFHLRHLDEPVHDDRRRGRDPGRQQRLAGFRRGARRQGWSSPMEPSPRSTHRSPPTCRWPASRFGTNVLTLDYNSSDQFEIGGKRPCRQAGVTGMQVTFGSGGSPGLVISRRRARGPEFVRDQLVYRLGVTVAANDLIYLYSRERPGCGELSTWRDRRPSARRTRLSSLDVTFGNGTTPGLVISGGSLASLEMIVTGSFTVESVSFAASDWRSILRRPHRPAARRPGRSPAERRSPPRIKRPRWA